MGYSTESSYQGSEASTPASSVVDEGWVYPAVPPQPQTVELSIIDQAVVRAYSTYFLCFPLDPACPPLQAYEHLRNGLSRTLVQFPLLASRISHKSRAKDTLQLDIDDGAAVRFGYKEFTEIENSVELPYTNYKRLQDLHFPPTILGDASIGFVASQETYPSDGAPVFVSQANFVEGGILLFCAISHQVADVTGTESIIRLWSKNTAEAAKDIPLNISEPVLEACMDRERFNQGINDPSVPASSWATRKDESIISSSPKPQETSPCVPEKQPDNPSMIWYIEPEQLKLLKTLASPVQDGSGRWISTLDALQALLWRQVSKARCLHAKNVDKTTMYFVCDLRNKLDPPVQSDSVCNVTIKAFVEQAPVDFEEDQVTALRQTAWSIREVINTLTSARFSRWIGFLQSAPTMCSLLPRERLSGGPDMVVTDHSKVSPYKLDWGPLGHIDCWRKVWWSRSNASSQCTVLPQLPDGGLEIMTNFEDDINDRLRQDQELGAFLQFRCR